MGELRAVIALLKRPEFKPAEIEVDSHNGIARAVHDKMIKSFDMRESSRDCDQDLTMFHASVEEVVKEIMGDSRFRGYQRYKFEAEFDYDADRERLWAGEATAGVAFQIGNNQVFYIPCIYMSYALDILQVF